MTYEAKTAESRAEKNNFFKGSYSPLTEEQKKEFTELQYYSINSDYHYSVKLKLFSLQEEVKIMTSKGEIQDYIKHGYIEFVVNSEKCVLTVFKQPHSSYFFVPFKDKTSGKKTYGSGRYVELEHTSDDEYILDFNNAYNPYCAYNDQWVCPLTPSENILKVEILAGEKSFK